MPPRGKPALQQSFVGFLRVRGVHQQMICGVLNGVREVGESVRVELMGKPIGPQSGH